MHRKRLTYIVWASFILVWLACVFLAIKVFAQDKLVLPEVKKTQKTTIQPQTPQLASLTLPQIGKPESRGLQSPQLMGTLSLQGFPARDLNVGTDRFEGGLNLFFPEDRLSPNQALRMLNLVPDGLHWIKKRDGYQKIYFTSKGSNWGMAIADSAGSKPHLVVASDTALYWADSSSNWELTHFGTTTAELTYFSSTPFGLVISNDGTDSTRLWDGASVKGLGICETGTFMADSTYTNGDTAWVADSLKVWAVDYWIGYWARCQGQSVLYKIIDSGVNWLVLADCRDSCDAESSFVIIARPDSVSGGLIYPKGQATCYFQDKLFVSSAYYPHRIYYSEVRLPDDIPIDHIINLDMDAHDQIQKIVLFNNNMIVFGKYSLYGINSSLAVSPITKSLGCDAPKTIAIGDDYIYFKSHRGIYRFKGNVYGSFSYNLEPISDPISDIVDNIDPQNLDNCGGLYFDKQYWFSYHPDSCLVFDERTKQWLGPSTFGFTDAINFSSTFNKVWNEILLPNADGDTTVWALSTGSDHYALIDDISDDTDYITTDAYFDTLDFLEFANTAHFPTGSIVSDLWIYFRANKYPYCPGKVDLDMVANGQRYYLDRFSLSGDWTTYSLNQPTNPITDLAWTKGDLDSLELALVSQIESACTYAQINVSGLWVVPQYGGNLSTGNFLFGGSGKDYIYKYGGTVFSDDTTSDSTYNISGKPIKSIYQSGWFDGGFPANQKVMRDFLIETEKDVGTCSLFIYKDFETTAIDTQTITSSGKNADWLFLPATVAGKKFSIKMETGTDVDSLTIKSWSALLRDLGKRK